MVLLLLLHFNKAGRMGDIGESMTTELRESSQKEREKEFIVNVWECWKKQLYMFNKSYRNVENKNVIINIPTKLKL